MKIGLVLLNRNEETSLQTFLPKISGVKFEEVYAIDGGSIDRSVELLKGAGIRVISQTASGRGNAFKIAFTEAKKLGLDALVFISTDGNEDPKSLDQFVALLNQGYELVIGSRMMRGAINEEDIHLFRPRKWANNLFATIAWLMFGVGRTKRITDPINGYRAITVKLWNSLDISAEAYDVEFQTSIRTYRKRVPFMEFPTHELPRVGGQSGATAWKTTISLLKVLIRELRHGRSPYSNE